MLMGFQLDTLADLQPHNPRNSHTWDFPPTIILRTFRDEDKVVERVNKTISALTEKVSVTSCLMLSEVHMTALPVHMLAPASRKSLLLYFDTKTEGLPPQSMQGAYLVQMDCLAGFG